MVKGRKYARGGKNSQHMPKIFGRTNLNYIEPRSASQSTQRDGHNVKSDFATDTFLEDTFYNLEDLPERKLSVDYCYDLSEYVVNNMKDPNVAFGTITGSFLYGTAHEDSDVDIVVVSSSKYDKDSTHKLTDDLDVRVLSMDSFVRSINKGAPLVLDILYSPYKTINKKNPYYHMLNNYRVPRYKAVGRYLLESESYYLQALKKQDSKDNLTIEDKKSIDKKLRHCQRTYEGAMKLFYEETYNPVWKELGKYDRSKEPINLYDIPESVQRKMR